MRLTLRTLLSYLDDTLEPAQAKAIGQKLAESETAQELVERIRQVSRRRRLTTPPPTGPGGIDPNTIADYLDNEVTPEQAQEVEQICLASDVHLAEVAACHQILTLVLGEPALISPAVKERMYRLVKGPASIPNRKPAKDRSKDDFDLSGDYTGHIEDDDDAGRGSAPGVGAGLRSDFALIVGGLAAVVLLGMALVLILSGTGPFGDDKNRVVVTDPKKGKKDLDSSNIDKKTDETKKIDDGKKDDLGKKTDEKVDGNDVKSPEVEKKTDQKKTEEKKIDDKKIPEIKPAAIEPGEVPFEPPSDKIAFVGKIEESKGPIALFQIGAKGDWQKLGGKFRDVATNRPLMSLPGCRSTVTLAKNVRLDVWGNLPEFWPNIYESAVILHSHDKLDLDVSLLRGRIVVSNMNENRPVTIRVRIENPAFVGKQDYADVQLEKQGEVALERWFYYPRNEGFFDDPRDPGRKGPITDVVAIALKGMARFKSGDVTVAISPNTGILWNNQKGLGDPFTLGGKPAWAEGVGQPAQNVDAKVFAESIKFRDEMLKILGSREVYVALAELLNRKEAAPRQLALRCYGALGDLPRLLEALEQEEKPELRLWAIDVLRNWIAATRDNDYKLVEVLEPNYQQNGSKIILELLHSVSETDSQKPETYERLIEFLDSPHLVIRELAAWHLYKMVPQGKSIPWSAAAPAPQRQATQRIWTQLIPRGRLPGATVPKSATPAKK